MRPQWAEVYGAINSCWVPFPSSHARILFDLSSPLSVWYLLTLRLVSASTIFSHARTLSNASDFLGMGNVHPQLVWSSTISTVYLFPVYDVTACGPVRSIQTTPRVCIAWFPSPSFPPLVFGMIVFVCFPRRQGSHLETLEVVSEGDIPLTLPWVGSDRSSSR